MDVLRPMIPIIIHCIPFITDNTHPKHHANPNTQPRT